MQSNHEDEELSSDFVMNHAVQNEWCLGESVLTMAYKPLMPCPIIFKVGVKEVRNMTQFTEMELIEIEKLFDLNAMPSKALTEFIMYLHRQKQHDVSQKILEDILGQYDCARMISAKCQIMREEMRENATKPETATSSAAIKATATIPFPN